MMRLYTMAKPQCLLYSAAMLLNTEPSILIQELGHDGMKVWWPQYDDHRKYRGHSMQEMIDIFLKRNKTLTPIQTFPMQAPDGQCIEAKPTFEEYAARFYAHISGKPAILIGKTNRGNGHAWAWSGFKVYDPRGQMYNINDLAIREAWLMHSIKSDEECGC